MSICEHNHRRSIFNRVMGEGKKMGNALGHRIQKTQTFTTPTFRNKPWRNILHCSCTKMHEIKPKHAPIETTYNFWFFTSSSLLSFFLLSCFAFGSKFGGNAFTKPAAVSAILWIWASTRTGVSCRGEVDMHG